MIDDTFIPITAAVTQGDETLFEDTLRPRKLEDFVGQDGLVSNLKVFIQAAMQRGEPLEHILFYGPPGLGKTTLSMIISHEMSSKLHVTAGPVIERAGDLAALLTNLAPNDVLFIDEIHRLRPNVEEILYTAMEDGVLDIMIGKGPTAKSMRIDIVPFTLVGATTRLSAVSSPLRDRFGSTHKLEFYEPTELKKILGRTANILNVMLQEEALEELAKRSRGTPRIANRLLRRVRDFAQVEKKEKVDSDFVHSTLERLHVDAHGLDRNDLHLLETIQNKFGGGPVGLTTLAAALSEESATIEDVYEPFLLQKGFIQRTARGRTITEKGREYLSKLRTEK